MLKNKTDYTRLLLAGASLCGLLLIFLFQKIDYSGLLGLDFKHASKFIFNRSVRFILNDSLSIMFIYALFYERKYVVFALWVQALGIVLFLVPYFMLRFGAGLNGPVISFLHRLTVNPTLVLLLIPAFYFQKKQYET